MFRLDNILEKWAEVYQPISHTPGAKSKHRAFFRINSMQEVSEFTKNANLVPSPCMAYGSVVDAKLQGPASVSYLHRIFFIVKQKKAITSAATDLDATECKFMGNDMVVDLLAFLSELKTAASNGKIEKLGDDTVIGKFKGLTAEDLNGLRGLQITSAEWGSDPRIYNGWWVVELDIEQIVMRNLCVIETKYKL